MIRRILLCLIFLFMFSCSNKDEDGQIRIMPSINVSPLTEATPTPVPLRETIAHSPLSPLPTPTNIPQPTVGKGVITGDLTWFFEGELRIGNEVPLQIGKVLYDTEGTPRLHSIDIENDPTVWTDKLGSFAFLDVEPGTYGLYLTIPGFDSFLLTEHGEPLALMIEVKANEITNLGDIILDFPF